MFYPLNYEGKVTQKYEKKMSILYNVLNQNGKRIKTQAHYEYRRHDTPAKPRVARVPKARTEPWVYTDNSGLSSVGAAL